jgi:type II secretory pathway component PulK
MVKKKTKSKKDIFNKKGSTILFAILLLFILLVGALGFSNVLLLQIRMVSNIGNSVQAYFAAETGIENALYLYLDPDSGGYSDINEKRVYDGGDAKYSTKDCSTSGNTCFKSTGSFRGTKRSIEVRY